VLIVVAGWIAVVWAVLIVASNAMADEPGPWLPYIVSALVVAVYGATLIKRDRGAVSFTWVAVAVFGAAVILGGLVPLMLLAWGVLLGFAFYLRPNQSELRAS
jgi:hypothetical protein